MNRFTLGTFVVSPAILDRVLRVLLSGRLSYGKVSREFEARFAEIHGQDFAVLSNSGTSSLVVAIQAMKEMHGWADGDEVIVPATTFVATVNAVLHNRLTPVLVDVHPRYYDINSLLIHKAITHRSRAILPASLFGYPADLESVEVIANTYGLKIVHDSCETMFSAIHNTPTATWADISCYSMYMAHTLVAGVGGIATCDNPDYYMRMRSLVNHGIQLESLPVGADYDPTFLARSFTFSSIGHSFRVTELEAAIAIAQLDDWREIRDKRNMVSIWIDSRLVKHAEHLQLPEKRQSASTCPMVYPIVMKNEKKHRIMEWLRSRGIECRDFLPLTTQPCYAGRWRVSDYPVSERLNEYGFYIGCHQGITRDDVEYLAEVFDGYFKKGTGG